jgi:F-type H+-transporting ATPase subunit delta
MYQSQINVRYAKSLFLVAKENKKLEEITNDISLLLQTFQDVDDFKMLVEHPIIKPSEKSKILESLFSNTLEKYTMSFLLLTVKNKRESHLKNMCLNFLELYRKDQGIKQAVLTTAFELSEKERKTIKESIQKKFSATVELTEKVNQDLIGGMIIQVDDQQLDLSVAKQIQNLRNDFHKIDFNNKKRFK